MLTPLRPQQRPVLITSAPRRGPPWRGLALALAWGQATAAPAAPAASDPPQRAASTPAAKQAPRVQPELLLLDLKINSTALPDVILVELWPDGTLLLPKEAWAEARLAPLQALRALGDGTPAFALNAMAGATWVINRQRLSLEINVPAAAFVGSTRALQDTRPEPPPRPAPGLLLNYDVSLARSAAGGPLAGGALLEAVVFSRFGHLVNSALLRGDGTGRTATRLDTFWRFDQPHRLETLVLGDTVGVAGGWSRPARAAGRRWGRDFGMRPGFVTLPQLTLSGEAALPSTVEVLVNNTRRLSQPMPPGPFELRNVPIVTGASEVSLVVRDLLGRETVIHQSYYTAPNLLAPGLTDFSFEAGRLRTGYGDSSAYGDAFGAATWRQGLSQSLSGEARLELQARRSAAGVELVGLLGQWGAGRVALAASSGSTPERWEGGTLLKLGLERSTPHGGGALQFESASLGFAPFGEAIKPEASAQRPRASWMASLGGPVWATLSGGISYVQQTRWDGERVQALALSTSVPLWPGVSVGLSLNKRLDGDGAWSAGANLSLPLGSGVYSGARISSTSGSPASGGVSASSNAPAGPGLGWQVEASTQESQRARAGLNGNTNQLEWRLDMASDATGQLATRASGRGTLGLLAGLPFASRAIGQGSFAVVEVGGLAGVPVKSRHQVVATTDGRGLALVPGLLPWQINLIEIDPIDLPLDVEVGNVVQQVTPYPGSGSVLHFAVRRTRQALLVLRQADGQPVPVGTRVRLLPAGPAFVAGRRGEVWLTDLTETRQAVQVRWSDGACQLEFHVPEADGQPANIGPLVCNKDSK